MHADHFIWSAYGAWLPSCPRESWPRYIRSWERSRTGWQTAGETSTGQTLAVEDPFSANRRSAEKSRLFPPVRFNDQQRQAIAEGFERCVRSRQAWVWACCILPEYVHMLITCPRTPTSQLIGLLRSEATRRLTELNLHPMSEYKTSGGQTPLMWSHNKWHQQLKDDNSVSEAIAYIEGLPEREGAVGRSYAFVQNFQSLERCREESEEYLID